LRTFFVPYPREQNYTLVASSTYKNRLKLRVSPICICRRWRYNFGKHISASNPSDPQLQGCSEVVDLGSASALCDTSGRPNRALAIPSSASGRWLSGRLLTR